MSTELDPQAPEELVEVVPDGDILASREAGGRFLRGSGMRMVGFGAGLLVGPDRDAVRDAPPGAVNWGHFITVTSLIFIAAALTEGGVANLGVREFSTAGDAERRAFMSDLLGLRLVLSLLGALGALAFALAAGYPERDRGGHGDRLAGPAARRGARHALDPADGRPAPRAGWR